LSDIYHLRATFVTRGEGFNVILKRCIDPHNFFQQYLKLQEKIDVAEDSVEFKDEDKIVRVWEISLWKSKL
jgi:hypothetical protein